VKVAIRFVMVIKGETAAYIIPVN